MKEKERLKQVLSAQERMGAVNEARVWKGKVEKIFLPSKAQVLYLFSKSWDVATNFLIVVVS
jgi:hypothetical protein